MLKDIMHGKIISLYCGEIIGVWGVPNKHSEPKTYIYYHLVIVPRIIAGTFFIVLRKIIPCFSIVNLFIL